MNSYAAIGLPIRTHTDFTDYLAHLVDDGEIRLALLGMYIRWHTHHGAELWAQIADNGEILNVEPFFAGRGRLNLELLQRYDEDEALAMAGVFEGRIDQSTPSLRFDCPMYALNDDLILPSQQVVQATLFAHMITLFPDLDALLTTPWSATFPSLAHPHDIAINPRSSALVMLTGTILQAALLNNPIGNASFWWILVQTHGGTVDIVCEPYLIEGSPLNGGVIQCLGQLSGAIIR